MLRQYCCTYLFMCVCNVHSQTSVAGKIVSIVAGYNKCPDKKQMELAQAQVFKAIEDVDDAHLKKGMDFLRNHVHLLKDQEWRKIIDSLISLTTSIEQLDASVIDNREKIVQVLQDFVLNYDIEFCAQLLEILEVGYCPVFIEAGERFFLKFEQVGEEHICIYTADCLPFWRSESFVRWSEIFIVMSVSLSMMAYGMMSMMCYNGNKVVS